VVNRGIDAVTPSVSFYFLMENKRKETVKRQLLPKKSRSWNLSVRRICPRVPTSRIIGNRVSEVTSLCPIFPFFLFLERERERWTQREVVSVVSYLLFLVFLMKTKEKEKITTETVNTTWT